MTARIWTCRSSSIFHYMVSYRTFNCLARFISPPLCFTFYIFFSVSNNSSIYGAPKLNEGMPYIRSLSLSPKTRAAKACVLSARNPDCTWPTQPSTELQKQTFRADDCRTSGKVPPPESCLWKEYSSWSTDHPLRYQSSKTSLLLWVDPRLGNLEDEQDYSFLLKLLPDGTMRPGGFWDYQLLLYQKGISDQDVFSQFMFWEEWSITKSPGSKLNIRVWSLFP